MRLLINVFLLSLVATLLAGCTPTLLAIEEELDEILGLDTNSGRSVKTQARDPETLLTSWRCNQYLRGYARGGTTKERMMYVGIVEVTAVTSELIGAWLEAGLGDPQGTLAAARAKMDAEGLAAFIMVVSPGAQMTLRPTDVFLETLGQVQKPSFVPSVLRSKMQGPGNRKLPRIIRNGTVFFEGVSSGSLMTLVIPFDKKPYGGGQITCTFTPDGALSDAHLQPSLSEMAGIDPSLIFDIALAFLK